MTPADYDEAMVRVLEAEFMEAGRRLAFAPELYLEALLRQAIAAAGALGADRKLFRVTLEHVATMFDAMLIARERTRQ